jgi:hypothetical protein
MIAPIGVVSKNFIGEPSTPLRAPVNRFNDAVNPAHANANELKTTLVVWSMCQKMSYPINEKIAVANPRPA